MNVGGNCEFIKVYSGKRSGNEVNQKANALLISKAHEMLEMLQYLNRRGGLGLDIHNKIEQLIKQATEL